MKKTGLSENRRSENTFPKRGTLRLTLFLRGASFSVRAFSLGA